jgi:hypothetical protein
MWNGNNVNRQTITRWLRPVHKIDFGQSYLCALTPNWTLSYKQGSEASGLSTCGELGPRVELWFIGGTFTPVVKTLNCIEKWRAEQRGWIPSPLEYKVHPWGPPSPLGTTFRPWGRS